MDIRRREAERFADCGTGGAISRSELRDGRPAEERWRWLHEFGFYPVQRPVRPSTEDPGLGDLGREIESLPWTEIEEGGQRGK